MVTFTMNMGNSSFHNEMPVYWVSSYQMGHLWFEFWVVENGWIYTLTLFALIILCIFNHFLFWFSSKHFQSTMDNQEKYASLNENEYVNIRIIYIVISNNSSRMTTLLGTGALIVLKIVAYALHTLVSAFTMLAIMKYNVGVMIALVVGNTVGFIIFSLALKHRIPNQQCH